MMNSPLNPTPPSVTSAPPDWLKDAKSHLTFHSRPWRRLRALANQELRLRIHHSLFPHHHNHTNVNVSVVAGAAEPVSASSRSLSPIRGKRSHNGNNDSNTKTGNSTRQGQGEQYAFPSRPLRDWHAKDRVALARLVADGVCVADSETYAAACADVADVVGGHMHVYVHRNILPTMMGRGGAAGQSGDGDGKREKVEDYEGLGVKGKELVERKVDAALKE
ncbi:hypothetical protein HK102_005457, partial [Quaeritorhiza haematococci]